MGMIQASHEVRGGTDTAVCMVLWCVPPYSAIDAGFGSIPAPHFCPEVATVASRSGGHGRCRRCRAHTHVSGSSFSKTNYRRANSLREAPYDFHLLRSSTRPSSQLNLPRPRLVSDLNQVWVRGRVALRRSEGVKDAVRISGSMLCMRDRPELFRNTHSPTLLVIPQPYHQLGLSRSQRSTIRCRPASPTCNHRLRFPRLQAQSQFSRKHCTTSDKDTLVH